MTAFVQKTFEAMDAQRIECDQLAQIKNFD